MKILMLFLIALCFSCATNKARRNIALSDIVINGGVFANEEWSEKMSFERTSWFREASMEYDILFHKLEKSSKFSSWLGSDKKFLDECGELYVALVYADLNAANGTPFLVNQIEGSGIKEVGIQTFKENLKAHENYRDWRLTQHKIIGFCKAKDQSSEIVISVPGFKSIKL